MVVRPGCFVVPPARMSQCFHLTRKNLTQWMDGRKATTQHTFALSGWQWKELFSNIVWFENRKKRRYWVCEHKKKVPSCTTFAFRVEFTGRISWGKVLTCRVDRWRWAVSICEAQFGSTWTEFGGKLSQCQSVCALFRRHKKENKRKTTRREEKVCGKS